MNTDTIIIRLEKKEEYREVENMVRESFWNVYRPGCMEHYVLHQLRNDPAFVPELDFVMYLSTQENTPAEQSVAKQDGRLIGAVTHVLVNDPTRGYGIFIEEMLKQP